MTLDPEDTFIHEEAPGLLVSDLLEGDGPYDPELAPPRFWIAWEALALRRTSYNRSLHEA